MTAEQTVHTGTGDAGAAITRNPLTKAPALTVTVDGKWTLFAGKDAASVDYTVPVVSGEAPGTYTLPEGGPYACNARWACFAFRRGDRTTLLAERHLPMAGGYNFRDLGGFSGADGKRVIWGKFFRTDGLGELTDADLAYLASIPIRTIVDFRTAEEAAHLPDRIPASVTAAVSLPIAPGYMNPAESRALEEYESQDAFMLHMYRDLAQDPAIAATYKRFFAHVQAEGDIPLIFHCSAGKDRTGVAAALLLTALGVDRETIFRDYEASNVYLGDKYAGYIKANPHIKGLFTVKEAFLAEAFALIEATHGSVESCLETVLGVDITSMRRRFLV